MANRSDNFNRADNSGPLGTPSDAGSDWVQTAGGGGALINTNRATVVGAAQQIVYLDSTTADVTVQATCINGVDNCGLVARAADNNNYLFLQGRTGGLKWTLLKKVGGSFTALISNVGSDIAANDVAKITCNGSALEIFVNGSSLGTVTETNLLTNTGHGLTARGSDATFDTFSITDVTSSSAVITEQNLPANHNGNITVHVVGTGTSFTSSTTWTPSGVSGWSVASKTQVDGTHYTVVLTPPAAATPPVGATGTLTLTEGVTGTTAPTTTVGTPSFTRSPTSGATGTTPTLTLTGTNTIWASETAAGLFTVSGGTGASLATPTVSTNTAATDVLTVGSATGTLTITDSSTGATVTFTANAGTLTITAPAAYHTYQRNGSHQASFTVSGTYTGTAPSGVDFTLAGSAYAALSGFSAGGGSWSGTATVTVTPFTANVQGDLIVRNASDHSVVSAAIAYVGVGDVFLAAGQSNCGGRGTNDQVYQRTPNQPKATLFGNDYAWKEMADWVDSNAGQVDAVSDEGSTGPHGSVWPAFCSVLMAKTGCPAAVIISALGGTTISQWQSGGSGPQDRTTLYGSSVYRAVNSGGANSGGVKGVLWWQGESDTGSQSSYHTALGTFCASMLSDVGKLPLVAVLQVSTAGAQETTQAVIRAAQLQAIGDSTAGRGPDFSDLTTTDGGTGLHFTTDASLTVAGTRWAQSVIVAYFTPAGGSGGLLIGGGMTGGTQRS